MKRININNLHEIVVGADLHRSCDKPNSVSVTTLIGPTFKAAHKLAETPLTHKLDVMHKRSAAIGTGFHLLAEKALDGIDDLLTEVYREEYIEFADIWLSGTLDVLVLNDETKEYEIGDFKTGYGKEFKNPDQAKLQMSIYRWLNRKIGPISDTAHVWFVSQSNNAMQHVEIQLMSLAETQSFIRTRIHLIKDGSLGVDCDYLSDGTKRPYKMCDWCEYECDSRR